MLWFGTESAELALLSVGFSVPMRMHRTRSRPVLTTSCCTQANNSIVCTALLHSNPSNGFVDGYNRSSHCSYPAISLPFLPLLWLSEQRLYPNLQLSAVLYVPLFDIHSCAHHSCHYWPTIASIAQTLFVSHYNQLMFTPSTSEPTLPPMDSQSHRY